MRAPVCVRCELQMPCVKTGTDCELMAGKDGYQIWSGDMFKCPVCQSAVVSSWAAQPVAEGHDKVRFASFLRGVTLKFWASLKEKKEAEA